MSMLMMCTDIYN